MNAVMIQANPPELVDISPADYKALCAAVGGDIQLIRFGDTGCVAYLNEDGKGLELPVNTLATQLCTLFNVGLFEDDYIPGNLVVCGPINAAGNDTDVPESVRRQLSTYAAFIANRFVGPKAGTL